MGMCIGCNNAVCVHGVCTDNSCTFSYECEACTIESGTIKENHVTIVQEEEEKPLSDYWKSTDSTDKVKKIRKAYPGRRDSLVTRPKKMKGMY